MNAGADTGRGGTGRGRTDAYDLAVIGAGSAGFSAALAAAERGASVALVGHGTLGGTCVNVGCVPSKTLIHAVATVRDARAASRFAGIEGAARVADWGATIRHKDALVDSLRRAKYADLLPAHDRLTYVEGRARLGDGGVAVDGAPLGAERILVATGARPAVPPIPGVDAVEPLTSDSALALATLPASLLVVGGGFVGVELAQLFARAGVDVTLTCRSRLLPDAEPEIGEALTRCLAEEGLRVVDGVGYAGFARTPEGVELRIRRQGGAETLRAERVLLAAGRTPNTEGLGLREAGVALDAAGAIVVDERMRTTRDGVYAAGDVTERDRFVYMAAHGGRIAALNALDGDRLVYDDRAVPAVVFTDPQAASVGATEAAARRAGHEVATRVLALAQVPRALAARDTRGLVKLVADARTGRLLGAHLLAPQGGDSIQTAALAIRHGMTVGELAATIFPYLTTVEALKLAAQSFERDPATLSCCAG